MAFPCTFVYASGKPCTGQIERIEVYKADLSWQPVSENEWQFSWEQRSHYHLFCSEKGNHAGYKKHDDDRMKFHWDELPEGIRRLLDEGSRFLASPR